MFSLGDARHVLPTLSLTHAATVPVVSSPAWSRWLVYCFPNKEPAFIHKKYELLQQ